MGSSNKLRGAFKHTKRELLPYLPSGSNPDPNHNLAGSSTAAGEAMVEGGVTAVVVEGAEEDDMLRDAGALSREEVLRRRLQRVRQLESLYRRQYWALMQDVWVQHRNYYWEFGVSPVEEEGRGRGSDDGVVGLGVGLRKGASCNNGGVERKQCAFSRCKSKAMPLTRYCHTHILSDSKQTLYKPCSYVIRRYGLKLILKVESLFFFSVSFFAGFSGFGVCL